MMRALLIPVLACLAGCNALTGPRQDFAIYALNPPMTAGQGVAVDWQLLVEEPHTSDLLDGLRIVVAPDGNERQVYRGARWVERTPGLLQGIWVRAFEADGRLPGVARAGSGLRADLILATDVTDFQAAYALSEPQIEVEIHARLIDPRTRRMLARKVFRNEQPASSDSIVAVVTAFDAALGQINPELVDWTLVEGERAMQSRADSEPTAARRR